MLQKRVWLGDTVKIIFGKHKLPQKVVLELRPKGDNAHSSPQQGRVSKSHNVY
jgi:hypothetical protein